MRDVKNSVSSVLCANESPSGHRSPASVHDSLPIFYRPIAGHTHIWRALFLYGIFVEAFRMPIVSIGGVEVRSDVTRHIFTRRNLDDWFAGF